MVPSPIRSDDAPSAADEPETTLPGLWPVTRVVDQKWFLRIPASGCGPAARATCPDPAVFFGEQDHSPRKVTTLIVAGFNDTFTGDMEGEGG